MENIVIYSINNCAYCDAAKNLLKNNSLAFNEINLSTDPEGRLNLVAKTGQRTMPQIFIGEKFIGGYTELKAYLQSTR
ncbi:MAG: glutaredoxin [Myxococcales bacterium]|nr:glutaredoxin [Myxococcales bacterium]USN50389.1 MAG: glutaredoxin [Myxococcales bacterium]